MIREQFDSLVDSILDKKYSMVDKYGFESVWKEHDKIINLEGDIIECGVYKGGMSLFLKKLFPNKKLWMLDSFELGFPVVEDLKYTMRDGFEDPHTKGVIIRDGQHGVPSSVAKSIFEEYGEGNSDVNIVEGYVSDTMYGLDIDKIALLRLDVDSYSATKELLEYFYPKVVEGGMIIFDDNNIDAARFAVEDFFNENNIPLVFHFSYPPFNIKGGTGSPCDYIFKGEFTN